MNYKNFGKTYIINLETHEEFTRELKKFCIENNIFNAKVSAIGAINSVTLGFFDTQKQEYIEQSMHKPFELSSLIGTITTNNIGEEPRLHVHATISDKDFRTYGGHLFRAVVSKTIEIVLTVLD